MPEKASDTSRETHTPIREGERGKEGGRRAEGQEGRRLEVWRGKGEEEWDVGERCKCVGRESYGWSRVEDGEERAG